MVILIPIILLLKNLDKRATRNDILGGDAIENAEIIKIS